MSVTCSTCRLGGARARNWIWIHLFLVESVEIKGVIWSGSGGAWSKEMFKAGAMSTNVVVNFEQDHELKVCLPCWIQNFPFQFMSRGCTLLVLVGHILRSSSLDYPPPPQASSWIYCRFRQWKPTVVQMEFDEGKVKHWCSCSLFLNSFWGSQ